MGSGTVLVLATPQLVALMEAAAVDALASHLDEGYTTVGGGIDMKHTAPTPVGATCTALASVTAVEGGTKVEFTIEARDEGGVVGTATHTRFVVHEERFHAKAEARTAGDAE